MNKEDLLAEVSLFWFMKRGDLRRIARRTQYHSYREGEVIITEGERDSRFFVILSGEAEVIKDLGGRNERRLATLGPRGYFGEMALMDDFVRSASVIARAETEVLSLDHWDLRQEIEKYPVLGIELLQMLSRRIRAIEKRMMNSLGTFLPICAHCKRIRSEDGSWTPIEEYIADHTEAHLSQRTCPDCAPSKDRDA